jgi:AcrR family transcriptional regulator
MTSSVPDTLAGGTADADTDAPRRPAVSPRVAARRAATREQILDAAWELARERGLTGFTVRELASRVGMRAPSLYEYFAGKDAIHDAMFGAANRDFLAGTIATISAHEDLAPRDALVAGARFFLDFAADDPVRFQLLFQRAILDWEPSPAAYAPALEAYAHVQRRFATFGAGDEAALDLWTAMVSGLAHQQLANDPRGHRWRDRIEEVVDLFLHHLATRSDHDANP